MLVCRFPTLNLFFVERGVRSHPTHPPFWQPWNHMFDYKAGDGGPGQTQRQSTPLVRSTSVCGIDLHIFYFFFSFLFTYNILFLMKISILFQGFLYYANPRLFSLFSLLFLTCSSPYSYNIMATTYYMCRLSIILSSTLNITKPPI